MTWTQTFTGKKFFPLAPNPDDVDIRDIAHALSLKCRYGGMTRGFYSVAQHSVLVAQHCKPEDQLRGLLHDAHEAYSPFGDIVRPVKQNLHPVVRSEIVGIEAMLDCVIGQKFGLSYPISNPAIAEIDTRILVDERRCVMTPTDHDWGLNVEPLGIKITPWRPEVAEMWFLEHFNRYTAEALERAAA